MELGNQLPVQTTTLKILLIIALLMTVSLPALANLNKNDPWGIAMGLRIARIPYPASDEDVADVIPLFFYDNKYVFLRGLNVGIKLLNKDEWKVRMIGR